MRQTATAKTVAPDPVVVHLEAARDEALASVRALLADDGPVPSGFPRETQVENALRAAETAERRLRLFGAAVVS